MRRKILPFVLGGALSIAAIAPAAAAPPVGFAGAAGLVNVVVQAVLDDVSILNNSLNDVVEVNIDDSLNNALQNVLQNARILNGLEVTIENVLNDLNVNVSDIDIDVASDGIVVNVLGAGGIADTFVLG
jgi:hypothetical protein